MREQLNCKDTQDEIEQSLALVDVLKALLETTKQHLNKVYILLIISLLSNLMIVGAFLWYESHMSTTVEKVVDTQTTQSVDGENSEINNVEGNQYKDNATHNEN